MTFLQRTTCYHDDKFAKLAVGWFSSGTGAAGLVGAGLWWELRVLGVRNGISISSVSFIPFFHINDGDGCLFC
jgi:battenin